MHRIIIIVVSSIIWTSCNSNKNEGLSRANNKANIVVDSLDIQARNDALNDFLKKDMKYFFHSIAFPDATLIQKFVKCEVSLISRNCILDKYEMKYNHFMDSIFYKENGVLLSSLLQ